MTPLNLILTIAGNLLWLQGSSRAIAHRISLGFPLQGQNRKTFCWELLLASSVGISFSATAATMGGCATDSTGAASLVFLGVRFFLGIASEDISVG
ncbi:hypothetical protein [Argonema antarcticum]|uniref:hypothetical protein n=1 Tax=Argonema antarcticum TaxID=2942763 RepID=UPI0020139716|nr:hypothetical protein [Argonema antarcticum]MCL1472786.1 hypothetical protein [Argonema antarcticum A004/B2]